MDFLIKYDTTIECRKCKVIFRPLGEQEFEVTSQPKRPMNMLISSMRTQKLLSSGSIGYLASIVDKEKEEKHQIDNVPVVCDYVEVLLDDLPG